MKQMFKTLFQTAQEDPKEFFGGIALLCVIGAFLYACLWTAHVLGI
jgi:hypothetical protein